MSNLEIREIPEKNMGRFEMHVEDHIAFIDYLKKNHTLILTHTEVPEEISGQGIGKKLVHEVLSHAENNSFKVIPRCSFIIGYMKRHPETQHLLEEGIAFNKN